MQEKAIQPNTVGEDGIYDKEADTNNNGCCFYCDSEDFYYEVQNSQQLLLQNLKAAEVTFSHIKCATRNAKVWGYVIPTILNNLTKKQHYFHNYEAEIFSSDKT